MMNEPILDKLYLMRLGAMAAAWQEQQRDTHVGDLSFDERFGLLVESEHLARDNRRLQRRLKEAELRIAEACLEDVATSSARGIEKATVHQLATCAWVDQHRNVLITGMTGVGKSYLACALAQSACRRGLRAIYRRVPRLFDELALAKADGTYTKVLAKLKRADVLVLDDLGLGHLTAPQRHDLLEVIEDRYGRSSTVITSQLPIKKWHDWIADPTVADAILDRLVHNAYKLDLQGNSRRKNITQD
jgi:DNA replication protein DnaC